MDVNCTVITGYHGTSSNYAESIEKHGLDPDKTHTRPDHWLGQGVYFLKILILQNGGRVIYQVRNIIRSYPVIYQAQIQAPREEVLDLDNYKEYDLFLNRILEMQNEIECDAKNRMPVFSPEQQRAVYFDYYKKMYHISVIMYTFSKDCAKYGTFRTGEDLAQQKKLEKALNIAYHEKQICVSQRNA